MNKHLAYGDMDIYDLLIFVGCCLYMAYFEGIVDRRMWCSNTEVNMFEGASGRPTKYMSLNRFEEILRNLSYYDKNAPTYNENSSTCIRWNMHGMQT